MESELIKARLLRGHLSQALVFYPFAKAWNCGKANFWKIWRFCRCAPHTSFIQVITPSQERPYNTISKAWDCFKGTICITRALSDSPRLCLFGSRILSLLIWTDLTMVCCFSKVS